jgi:hypothetical protein
MSTAAARQRAYRNHVRAGRWVLHVEIDDVRVPAALADAGLLDPSLVDDRDAVPAALERLIEAACFIDGDA